MLKLFESILNFRGTAYIPLYVKLFEFEQEETNKII